MFFPRRSETRYGGPMARMFEDELSDRRGARRIVWVIRAWVGLLVAAASFRLRAIRGWRGGTGLWLDLRLALRGLARRPGWSPGDHRDPDPRDRAE